MTRANLYVYYRADPARMDALRVAVAALFDAVSKTYGIRPRWMHRRNDATKCMEVYADVEDVGALAAFVERQCASMDFGRLLGDAETRHAEIFVDRD